MAASGDLRRTGAGGVLAARPIGARRRTDGPGLASRVAATGALRRTGAGGVLAARPIEARRGGERMVVAS